MRRLPAATPSEHKYPQIVIVGLVIIPATASSFREAKRSAPVKHYENHQARVMCLARPPFPPQVPYQQTRLSTGRF